jgi:hypothetical protein
MSDPADREFFLTGDAFIDALLEAEPRLRTPPPSDPVRHPKHYTSHPSGIEAIEITKFMNFCLGNAVKYILRADYKGDPITDLRKAQEYLQIEIDRRLGGLGARNGEGGNGSL